MAQTGTMYYGSSRKVSDAEGWAVTITKEAYGWTQAGSGECTASDGTQYRRSWKESETQT